MSYVKLSPSEMLRVRVKLEAESRFLIRRSCYTGYKNESLNVELPLPHNKRFIVMHFGIYAQTDTTITIPAEFAIGVFSVRDGMHEIFSRMVDPGMFIYFYCYSYELSRFKVYFPLLIEITLHGTCNL